MKPVEEIDQLARDLETDLVERKSSARNTDRIAEAMTAYANDLPGHGASGVILVGVDDAGEPTGLTIDDELLLALSQLRDAGQILPIPSTQVYRSHVAGTPVAVVEVAPSTYPPVTFRGRVCIRVGPRRAIATREEVIRLSERRRSAVVPFDTRPVPGLGPDELDQAWFASTYLPAAVPPDVLDENQRPMHERLQALRLLSPSGEATVAGVLVAGRQPMDHFAGDYVQYLRVAGTSLADEVIDERRFSGRLDDMIRESERQLRTDVRTSVDFTSTDVELKHEAYPLRALQQLVRNAIMHRTYEGTHAPVRVTVLEDRIEVQSPGGPFGTVTPENIGQGATDYRNPTIAEALHILGFVQRFGAGIPTVERALLTNGNPPLQLDSSPTHVLATVRISP